MGKLQDRHDEASRTYNTWGNSEEGRRNLRERTELIKQCKASSMEELGKAITAIDPNKATGTPAKVGKRTKQANEEMQAKCVKESTETPVKETPAKRHRAMPVNAAPTKQSVLDESVLG